MGVRLLGPPSAKHPRKQQLTTQGCERATAWVTGHPNPRERLSRTHNAKEELHDTTGQMKRGPGNDPEAFETRQAAGNAAQKHGNLQKVLGEEGSGAETPLGQRQAASPALPGWDPAERGGGTGGPVLGVTPSLPRPGLRGGTPVLGVREIHAAREGLAGAQPASARRSGTESCLEICRRSLTFRGA